MSNTYEKRGLIKKDDLEMSFVVTCVSNYLVLCNVSIVKKLVRKPEGSGMGLKSIFVRDAKCISKVAIGIGHGKEG